MEKRRERKDYLEKNKVEFEIYIIVMNVGVNKS